MKPIAYIEEINEWRSEFKFSIPINIRFSETDMFGHVNNVSVFIYFEEARIEFLKSLGLFGDASSNEGVPVVADLQCDYLQQMYFNEELRLFVKATHVGNTSIDIHYMALNKKGEITVTGRGRLVYVNPETGKPVLLSDLMKEKILNA